ncbi:hypothetical protein IQ22_01444 [Pseudomonas duriflava]|uniref:DUF2171 domain-containing protein n=1 Tax=Pseudomonas duriflava TaxID=459528 RepID=A0A562QH52_9PSED|nr:DUF2171 domain-containing protein [Pseudomonas duriflava]TWI55520.1 hypothetical protein IQ22_01444 [Pseudomonas duriflava]
MVDINSIQEHAEVIGSDGQHIGTVDHMEGSDRIKLTKQDQESQGKHHYIPLSWVKSVEGGKIQLVKTRDEAERDWQAA